MNNILKVKDLHKSFGRHAVLKGLSLSCAPGEVIGILGRNGTGKTTLFNILLDLTAADSGGVEILGLKPDGSGKLRGLIGYVPEKPAFHPFMTVREVLEFRAKFFPLWNMGKAVELCKKLELDLSAKTGRLSKGGIAKLAWIVAVAHNPALLLLDEPTSGLDYLVRDHILSGLISELAEGGKSIIVSNHRMGEMGGILDRVCLLKDGVIKADYTADFVKTEAFRVSARLEGGLPEAGPGVSALGGSGPLAELAVLGRANLERLKADPRFGKAEISPLEMDAAFKVMLGEREAL